MLVLAACLAATTAFGTGTAAADVASTSSASSVTESTAALHGVVYASIESEWFFQYGTSAAIMGSHTPPQLVGPGFTPVDALVSGLSPGTRYFFRVVLVAGAESESPTYTPGNTMSFTTLSPGSSGGSARYGRVTLRSHRLKVSARRVGVPVKCAGTRGARCLGRIALSARGKHGKTVSCATGAFSLRAVRTKTVRLKLSRTCLSLLKAGRRHRLRATLRMTARGGGVIAKTGVTLRG